ncbi:hypothetical protein EDM60_22515 [Brevibacillus parabrevis]|nr:hypothetical protein EDM60_22515 [Brevibacillus parabrevis]
MWQNGKTAKRQKRQRTKALSSEQNRKKALFVSQTTSRLFAEKGVKAWHCQLLPFQACIFIQ